MYAFIVTSVDLSQHTISIEIRGVFAHMLHAQYYANHLRQTERDHHVTVKRYQMQDGPVPGTGYEVEVGFRDLGRARLGPAVPAFTVPGPGGTPGVRPVGEGVQTDPTAERCPECGGERHQPLCQWYAGARA